MSTGADADVVVENQTIGDLGTPNANSEDDVQGSSSEEENAEDAVDLDAEEDAMDEEDSAIEDEAEGDRAGRQDNDENTPSDNAANIPSDSLARNKPRGSTCPLDLPISVVRRIMKGVAGNRRFTPELISALSRCAGVFALYVLSASQDAAVASSRFTIRPIEVIRALIDCGFPEIAEEARIAMDIKQSDIKLRKKKTMKKNVKKN